MTAPFNRYAAAGFLPDLLPILPPDAVISETSRVGAGQRGKAPGVRKADGTWTGLAKWAERDEAALDDVKKWSAWTGAGLGIRTGRLIAFDIDVTSADMAAMLEARIADIAGTVPVRYGRAPKRLMAYRIAEPLPKWAVRFEMGGEVHKVELLGQGQQFVAEGVHPKTGKPYTWRDGRSIAGTGFDGLPMLTVAQVDKIKEAIVDLVGMMADPEEVTAGGANDKLPIGHDAHLAPTLDAVKDALGSIPCADLDYDAWIATTAAVKAACGGSEDGFAVYEEWASAYGGNTPEVIRDKWDSITEAAKGWRGLVSQASEYGFDDAVYDWQDDPVPADADAAVDDLMRERKEAKERKAEERRARLYVVRWKDITPATEAMTFVEDLLGYGAMSVLYGESNVGKTFFAADLALHVAWGKEWRGREVDEGGVIYCALEGAHGIRNRVAAFREHHGLEDEDIPFGVVPVSLNLLDPEADTGPLIDLIRQEAEAIGVPVRLVVIDTLARAMAGGNENSSEDMGALVASMDKVREATGAHVMTVHHSGKDRAQGARGHSSLRAATDTEIEVFREDGAGAAVAVVKKQRDLEGGQKFPFKLESVNVGETPRGKVVTSCVVVEASEAEAGAQKNGKDILKGVPAVALQALADLLDAEGVAPPAGSHVPDGAIAVPQDRWRAECLVRGVSNSDNPESQAKAFRRATEKLGRGHLNIIGICPATGLVWDNRRPRTDRTDTDKSGQCPEVSGRTDTDTPL